MLYTTITAHNENNYRLANQGKRPFRMSWTLRAWSAPSFSQRGNDQKQKMFLGNLIMCCFVSHFITSWVFFVAHRCVNTVQVCSQTLFSLCSSATERDEWLEAISTAISDYTRKKISFISGKPPEEVRKHIKKMNLIHFLFAVFEPVLKWQKQTSLFYSMSN